MIARARARVVNGAVRLLDAKSLVRPRAGETAPPADPARAPVAAVGKLYVETYGCQMNVADSELITGMLGAGGYAVCDRPEDADVILVNTCAVREKAEERVYRRAQELAAQKKRRRGVVLGITGCMAEHLREKILERAPWIDVVAGPDSYRRLKDLVDRAREQAIDQEVRRESLVDVRLDKNETYEGLDPALGGDGVSGFVSIQRGCDKFCTFCVVPFTRGRERGSSPREILRTATGPAPKDRAAEVAS